MQFFISIIIIEFVCFPFIFMLLSLLNHLFWIEGNIARSAYNCMRATGKLDFVLVSKSSVIWLDFFRVWILLQVAKAEKRIKCTLIPGDGVGPELVYSVQEVFKVNFNLTSNITQNANNDAISVFFFKAANVPVDFETFFFSEINPVLSSKLEDVTASIAKNKICLKVCLIRASFTRAHLKIFTMIFAGHFGNTGL